MTSNLYSVSATLDRNFIDDSDESKDPTYTAVIANQNLTSYYTHLNSKVLRGFAKKAREGVMVLANHSRGDTVGRSQSGTYTQDGEVRSKFYIQRGLEFSGGGIFSSGGYKSTDDYISAINKGTYRDVSVGFQNYTEMCDYCGEEIKGSWLFSGDKNGHYPGQKIYVDDQGNEFSEPAKGLTEVLITAEVTTGDLFEYSLVDIGALPGAEVLAQAKLHQIDPQHKEYLLNRHGIDLDQPDQIRDRTYRFNSPIKLLPENKSYSFPDKVGDRKMSDVLKQSNEETIQHLQEKNSELLEENGDLKAQLDALDNQKIEYSEVVEENQELKQELEKAKKEMSGLSNMKDEYDLECVNARNWARTEYIRANGRSANLEKFDSIMNDTINLSDIKRLGRNWRVQGDSRLGIDTRKSYTQVSDLPDPFTYDPYDYV